MSRSRRQNPYQGREPVQFTLTTAFGGGPAYSRRQYVFWCLAVSMNDKTDFKKLLRHVPALPSYVLVEYKQVAADCEPLEEQ